MNTDGSNLRNLTRQPRLDTMPNWSPTGDYIVFASDRTFNPFIPNRLEQSWHYEIYLMDTDGNFVHRLTSNDFRDELPVWYPDSQQITYVGRGIHIMNKDGSNTRLIADGTNPVWSRDGTNLAYLSGGIHLLPVYSIDPIEVGESIEVAVPYAIEYMDNWTPELSNE